MDEGLICPVVSLYAVVDNETLAVLSTDTRLERIKIEKNLRYDLIADKVTEPGYLPERKARTTGGMRASAAYERLVAVGNMLMESIKRSRGRDNKSLARFADQLRQLLEKWES